MGAKEHVAWAVGALFVGLATEGWQGVVGENLAHSIGVPVSAGAVTGAVILGYLYSLFFEGAEKPKKKAPRPPKPVQTPKRKRH